MENSPCRVRWRPCAKGARIEGGRGGSQALRSPAGPDPGARGERPRIAAAPVLSQPGSRAIKTLSGTQQSETERNKPGGGLCGSSQTGKPKRSGWRNGGPNSGRRRGKERLRKGSTGGRSAGQRATHRRPKEGKPSLKLAAGDFRPLNPPPPSAQAKTWSERRPIHRQSPNDSSTPLRLPLPAP